MVKKVDVEEEDIRKVLTDGEHLLESVRRILKAFDKRLADLKKAEARNNRKGCGNPPFGG